MIKKIYILAFALLFSFTTFAGNFVMIPYSGTSELKKIFNQKGIKVHFFSDNQVFATVDQFNSANMTLIDSEAFKKTDTYHLVYCPAELQGEYLQRESGNAEVLLQQNDYVIVRVLNKDFNPMKNDGMVSIKDREARLPKMTRDFPSVTEENPDIRYLLDQVSQDSMRATVEFLQAYRSRKWNEDNAFSASDWIASKFEAMGLEVEQQPFTYQGQNAAPNVIAIQRGSLYPDIYVVCGSHFDSFSFSGLCPGADDNATGVASVLESARVMSEYTFDYSIIYCAFGAEEMGLIGSYAYASRCSQQNMEIIGYFNNDMNGYLSGDEVHIHQIYPSVAEQCGAFYRNVGSVYFPEMVIEHKSFSSGDSDHTAFNNNGYQGIYPFEDVNNYSPFIHTPGDTIGTSVNSWLMSQRYCQMNLACLSEVAGMHVRGPIVFESLVLDDTQGNGDGKLNAGESILLTVTMKNTFDYAVNDVNVTLQCADSEITIINSEANFGNFAAGESKTIEAAFSFSLSENATSIKNYKFNVEAVSGTENCTSIFKIMSYDFLLSLGTVSIVGDDNVLDPGETTGLGIFIENQGNEMAFSVSGTLSTSNENLNINVAEQNFGTIGADLMGYAVYNITLSENATANESIPFVLEVSDETGRSYSFDFTYTNNCNVIFDLADSYGDGWNGASITVSFDDGTPSQELTISNGHSQSYTIAVGTGTTVSLTWNSGSYDSECSYSIYYENGEDIYNGSGSQNGMFYSWQSNCAGGGLIPTLCSPVTDFQAIANADEVTLTWEAPENDEPESYDIYRETNYLGNVTETHFMESGVTDGTYDYCVYAVYDDCQSSFECIEVTVDILAVDEISEPNISVFPNPAKKSISITGHDLKQVFVYNLTGQQVMSNVRVENGLVSFDVSTLPSGMYLLKAVLNDGESTTKQIFVY
jgi:Predicted aminopeptidases